MSRRVHKEVDALLRVLIADHDCTATMTKSGHWKVSRPGHGAVMVSATPSDHRAMHKIKGELRRYLGVDLKR